jgi:hypothetical protein
MILKDLKIKRRRTRKNNQYDRISPEVGDPKKK